MVKRSAFSKCQDILLSNIIFFWFLFYSVSCRRCLVDKLLFYTVEDDIPSFRPGTKTYVGDISIVHGIRPLNNKTRYSVRYRQNRYFKALHAFIIYTVNQFFFSKCSFLNNIPPRLPRPQVADLRGCRLV